MDEGTLVNFLLGKAVVVVGVLAWLFAASRKAVTRDDLDKLASELEKQLEAKLSRREFEASWRSVDDDLKELKSDVREIRSMLVDVIQQRGKA